MGLPVFLHLDASLDNESVAADFGAARGRNLHVWHACNNVTPGKPMPIVLRGADSLHMGLARYGARHLGELHGAVTCPADDLPSHLRAACEKRRCLIPVRGFYTYLARPIGSASPRETLPSYFYSVEAPKQYLTVAGLYERDDFGTSFIVLTVPQTPHKSAYRYPLVIPARSRLAWLEAKNLEAVERISRAREFRFANHTVGVGVISPSADGAKLRSLAVEEKS